VLPNESASHDAWIPPRDGTRRVHVAVLYVGLCVLAGSVRASALWADRGSLLFETGGLDAPSYVDMARGFRTGGWPGPAPFFWAPGYPFFLSALTFISDSTIWFKTAQIALGTATVCLVANIALRLFRSVPLAATAGGLAALYGPLVYYDLQIAPATLDVFLSALFLAITFQAYRSNTPNIWLWSGVIAALAVVTRGALLIFLPFIVFRICRAGGVTCSARCVRLSLFVGPTLGMLLALAAHNYRYDLEANGKANQNRDQHPGLTLISYNLGINFALGNTSDLYRENDLRDPACFVNYKMLMDEPAWFGHTSGSGQSRYLLERTLKRIYAAPNEWILLLGRKLHELLHGQEISRDTDIYASRSENVVLSALIWLDTIAFPSGLLLPLALLGVAVARKRDELHRITLGFLFSQALFVLAFFVVTRYRLVLCTLAMPYAAYALAWAAVRFKLRAWRPLTTWSAALVVLIAATNTGLRPASESHVAFEYNHLGAVLAQRGDPSAAAAQWWAALKSDPAYAPAHFQLAEYYAQRGDYRQSEAHYLLGLGAAPAAYPARLEYSLLLARSQRPTEASNQLQRALDAVRSPQMQEHFCTAAGFAGGIVPSVCDRHSPH
jgi:tetratricopeptide (TPR) repeat protein